MTVLVTGATGTVGREVVRALLERGAEVRAMSRDPRRADLPEGVEVVAGDLTDLATLDRALDGVGAVHLITFDGARGGESLDNGAQIVELLDRRGVQRISVLGHGYPGSVEEAIQASSLGWTLLAPVEFMANARIDWAEPIRTAGRIEEPYVQRRSALVHEADIGDVAAVVLTEDGHGGRSYPITGGEVLTVPEKLATIGAALGIELELVGLSEAEAVARWTAQGLDEETIGFMKWVYGDPPEVGYTVVDTVPRLTGHPARTFADWAAEHVEEFR